MQWPFNKTQRRKRRRRTK